MQRPRRVKWNPFTPSVGKITGKKLILLAVNIKQYQKEEHLESFYLNAILLKEFFHRCKRNTAALLRSTAFISMFTLEIPKPYKLNPPAGTLNFVKMSNTTKNVLLDSSLLTVKPHISNLESPCATQ